jgi:hypothetical protein
VSIPKNAFRVTTMAKETIIDKQTLVPIGFVITMIGLIFVFYSKLYSEASKTEVQAAEISFIQKDYSIHKKDYIDHKKTSEKYFMSISKSLSRIEGKLSK